MPLGGPDGGDGGAGGSIILVADRNKHTLLDFQYQPLWKAEDGNPGEGGRRSGKAGKDLRIHVPVGTQVFHENCDDESIENLVIDLADDGREFIICQGGRGGKGNDFFKSATNRAPEHAQPGEEGQGGTYVLSLKLVADVGLIGFPNAGKSTLISRISAARPKIADYPFTTLTPNLGVVKAKGGFSFVVADIPGLIPGASEGKGLGLQFLKHVERTRVLVHLIDGGAIDESGQRIDPVAAFEQVNQELLNYSPELAKKPQIVALTKSDLFLDKSELQAGQKSLEPKCAKCLILSSASGEGIEVLIDELTKVLKEST